jgi:hypothetical protein
VKQIHEMSGFETAIAAPDLIAHGHYQPMKKSFAAALPHMRRRRLPSANRLILVEP